MHGTERFAAVHSGPPFVLVPLRARGGKRSHANTGGGDQDATHKSLGTGREHGGREDLLGPHLFNNCARHGTGRARPPVARKAQGNTGVSGRNPAAPPKTQASTRARSAVSPSASPAAGPSPSRQPPARVQACNRPHGPRAARQPAGIAGSQSTPPIPAARLRLRARRTRSPPVPHCSSPPSPRIPADPA